jgi:hypothetical protein
VPSELCDDVNNCIYRSTAKFDFLLLPFVFRIYSLTYLRGAESWRKQRKVHLEIDPKTIRFMKMIVINQMKLFRVHPLSSQLWRGCEYIVSKVSEMDSLLPMIDMIFQKSLIDNMETSEKII